MPHRDDPQTPTDPDTSTDPDAPRDPDRAPATEPPAERAGTGPATGPPELAELVARLADPEHGLTAHTRRFTRVDALAAVADVAAGRRRFDRRDRGAVRVLAEPVFVPLPTREASAGTAGVRRQPAAGHMRDAARYTTADVLAAERTILDAAAASAPDQDLAGSARRRPSSPSRWWRPGRVSPCPPSSAGC